MNNSQFPNDAHQMAQYEAFAKLYDIKDLATFIQLYDVFELVSFMPSQPTEEEKALFNELLGTTTDSGYMDYQRSNNTFELIMQWQERTGRFDNEFMPNSDELKNL